MIHDVDASLRTLLEAPFDGGGVDVVFDAPTKDWASRRNSPTIDAYLYDIREDVRRRETGRIDLRDDDGRIVRRESPPRWFRLSYLITAWTQRPEDEHRLLARVLEELLQFDDVPASALAGSLAGIPTRIPLTIGMPPSEDRALSDIWSALGGELKPSLDVSVLAPFDLSRRYETGPPVLETPRLTVSAETVARPRRKATASRSAASRRSVADAADAADAAVEPTPSATEEVSGGVDPQRGRVVRVIEYRSDPEPSA